MNLKTRLLEDMQRSMKQREAGKLRLEVLRMARAAIKNAEVAEGRELDESGVLEVLAKEVKMRREALAEYGKLDRPEAVAKLREEIAILLEYMPRQLSREEITKMAQDTISKVGASGPSDLGKVMGHLMSSLKGRADGNEVREIVERLLGSASD